LHIGKATADTFNGFLEVLALPLKVGAQGIVERGSGILSPPLRVLFELRSPLRF
jgi:hypothetical protein